jgi:heme-degrading monooxygenase HmoA
VTIFRTPEPPYYAAIFSIVRTGQPDEEYERMGMRMHELAVRQDGFIGFEYSPESPEGFSLSVSYWRDEESIRRWKAHSEHLVAQQLGKQRWYSAYTIRIARVERAYSFGAI